MSLLLDLGNTRIKWSQLRADGRLAPVQSLAWAAWPGAGPLFQGVPSAATVLAASVVGAEREAWVTRALRERGLAVPKWIRSPAAGCGVRNAYPEPTRLGVDRFLGMVTALHAGLAPCVMVGAGTALTLDALAADGRHLGGLIAPGLGLMQQSLQHATANLPDPGDAPVLECANSTGAAIVSGCWHAALGLIERFHARMSDALGGAPGLVLAGGDATALASRLAVPSTLHVDAVLRGLAVWAQEMHAAG